MEAAKVNDLAINFADKVDYRTRLHRPETWFEWFVNEIKFSLVYEDFLVFSILTERILHIQKLNDIESAFIIGVETGMIEADKIEKEKKQNVI